MSKKRTHEEFLNCIDESIEVLNQYENQKSRIKCRCKLCGYEWETNAASLIGSKNKPPTKCPKRCQGTSKKKTHEQFIQEFKNNNSNADSIIFLSNYIGACDYIKCKCLKCNHEWEVIASNICRLSIGCPNCKRYKISKAQIKTQEEFNQELKLLNPNIETLEPYTGRHNKIKSKCLKHNIIWEPFAASLLKGCGCKECFKEKTSAAKSMTYQEFINRFNQIEKFNNLKIISKYINATTNIKCYCKIHNYEFETTPSRLLSGNGCKYCGYEQTSLSQRKTNKQFLLDLKNKNLKSQNFKVLEEYKGGSIPIKLQCNICNTIWYAAPRDLLGTPSHNPTGCPRCAGSYREFYVYNILNKLNNIEQQYKIFINNHIHFFDFYIPSKNIYIEYDGEQHYYPVNFSGHGKQWAQEQFNIRQIRDAEKDMWCFINGYELIRIPYTMSDEDIEKLLIERLCD